MLRSQQQHLRRLARLSHISEYTTEKLITDFGLYESAIIDLTPVDFSSDENPRIEVSDDIKRIQKFLISDNPMMLPCPECKREIPFNPKRWENPREMEKIIQSRKNVKLPTNLNDEQGQHHKGGNDCHTEK